MRWSDSTIFRKAARKRRVEGQNAVLEQPLYHLVASMTRQVIPDENETERRGGYRLFIGLPLLLPGKQQRVIIWQGNAP